jgi:hypothetical protein
VPVLAQFQQPAQILGLGFPGAVGDRAFRAAAWGKERAERVIQLPPRGEVRFAMVGVCLEYGKRTPNSRMRYDVVPVQQVAADSRLEATLQALAEGNYEQQAVQAVAWHLANGMTERTLRGKFSAREFQSAQRLMQEVSKPREVPATPAPSSKALQQ